MGRLFTLLEKLMDEYHPPATAIYNMDETGLSSVQSRSSKVLGRAGKHQIGIISSADRGLHTTVVCSTSAAGHYVPPYFLFKRTRMTPLLGNDAPPGSVIKGNDSGWMTQEKFLEWLQHFINTVKPSVENKVLLILDGHSSHTGSLAAIDLARENGVVMLCLPPHTTNKLQPLDVSFFRPLKTHFLQAQETWLRNNPGRKISAFQIAHLVNSAYSKAASIPNAVSGFEKTGIFPCNRHVFADEDFAASTLVSNTPGADEPVRGKRPRREKQNESDIPVLTDSESDAEETLYSVIRTNPDERCFF
ncbi:hypothetical protein BaRGS_00010936 [Batillaria attramentaria]|uniref:DDE-1 domain-containing protein n=1 Tax=Batillaria attramentaria TaxID=370345 RepID=A0ABD0LFG7_9CAEN